MGLAKKPEHNDQFESAGWEAAEWRTRDEHGEIETGCEQRHT
jgi:hypothetical protein